MVRRKGSVSRKVNAPKGNAAGRDIDISDAPQTKISSISGGTNLVGNQGDIHLQITTASPKRPRITVQPGPQHISDEQKVALNSLREEWMALHAAIKRKPLEHGMTWRSINKAAGATSYHLILTERYQDAVAFIRREMAILRNMRSAPSKDGEWRSKRIAAIKVRCIRQLGDPHAYKAYIKKNFGVDSLADLATDQLQKTYAYIMAKK